MDRMSVKRYMNAAIGGDDDTRAQETTLLARNHARLPDGDEKTRFGETLNEFRQRTAFP